MREENIGGMQIGLPNDCKRNRESADRSSQAITETSFVR